MIYKREVKSTVIVGLELGMSCFEKTGVRVIYRSYCFKNVTTCNVKKLHVYKHGSDGNETRNLTAENEKQKQKKTA